MTANTITEKMQLAGWRVSKMHRHTKNGHLVTVRGAYWIIIIRILSATGESDDEFKKDSLSEALAFCDSFAENEGGWHE